MRGIKNRGSQAHRMKKRYSKQSRTQAALELRKHAHANTNISGPDQDCSYLGNKQTQCLQRSAAVCDRLFRVLFRVCTSEKVANAAISRVFDKFQRFFDPPPPRSRARGNCHILTQTLNEKRLLNISPDEKIFASRFRNSDVTGRAQEAYPARKLTNEAVHAIRAAFGNPWRCARVDETEVLWE